MKREERLQERWETIKSKGKKSYLINTGILQYGSFFFMIWVFLAPLIDHNFSFIFVYKDTFKIKLIVFGILSPIVGMYWAYMRWRDLDKKYCGIK